MQLINSYVKENTNLSLVFPRTWLDNVKPTEKNQALNNIFSTLKSNEVIFVARSTERLIDEFRQIGLKMPNNIAQHYVKEWPMDLVEGVKYLYEPPAFRRLTTISKQQFVKAINSKKVATWGTVGVKSPLFSREDLKINYRDVETLYGIWLFNGKKKMGPTLYDLGGIDRSTEDMGLFGSMVRNSNSFDTNDGITAVVRQGKWCDGATNVIKQKGFQLSTPVYVYTVKDPSEAVKRILTLIAKD